MANVVSFINMKGGVGKTTMAVNIGYTLSKQFKKKVLLIDVDPQMNATQYSLKNEQVLDILKDPRKSVYGILYEDYDLPSVTKSPRKDQQQKAKVIFEIDNNFDIIPSHLQIMGLNLGDSPFRLRQYIKANRLKDKYDVIILDSPPTISAYTKICLLASDAYVVPMKTDFLSLFGFPLLENYIQRLKKEFDLQLEFLGIILTMVRPDWQIYGKVKKELTGRLQLKNKLFSSELKYRTAVAKALSPDEREKTLPFIAEINDNELKTQIVAVTEEFMQRERL